MIPTPTHNWPGKSGKTYAHYVYPIGTKFAKKPGNYIFCKQDATRRWTPLYIGESKSLGERHKGHEKNFCALVFGATHVHAHLNAHESDRLAEEKDLIQKHTPLCNRQLLD